MTIKQVITLQGANTAEYTLLLSRMQAWLAQYPSQIESVTGKSATREVTVVGKVAPFVFAS